MKLSEHIAQCQKMLEKFGDARISLPASSGFELIDTGVAVVYHYVGSEQEEGFYTLRKNF